MTKLKSLDNHNKLTLVDITDPDFHHCYPEIDVQHAHRILHGKLNDQLLYGLDVTYWAWRLVGKSMWVAPLRWPLIKPLADLCYLFFARYRQTLSRVLMPNQSCDDRCRLPEQGASQRNE